MTKKFRIYFYFQGSDSEREVKDEEMPSESEAPDESDSEPSGPSYSFTFYFIAGIDWLVYWLIGCWVAIHKWACSYVTFLFCPVNIVDSDFRVLFLGLLIFDLLFCSDEFIFPFRIPSGGQGIDWPVRAVAP